MTEPTLSEIQGRHLRGEGWIPGKHYATQCDEDIAVLLAEVNALREALRELVEDGVYPTVDHLHAARTLLVQETPPAPEEET